MIFLDPKGPPLNLLVPKGEAPKPVFADAIERFGADEWSPNVIRRLEEQSGRSVLAPGFPPELEDHAPRVRGAEVILPKSG